MLKSILAKRKKKSERTSQNPGPFRKKLRLIRSFLLIFLGMGLGAFILAFVSAGEIYDYQDTVDGGNLPPVDAVVCLAGGRGRIAAAGDIWYRYWEMSEGYPPGKPPVLYISGMGHQSTWAALALQLRAGVFKVMKSENAVMEKESVNTDENARWLVNYAKEKGWKRILLMTSRYHMKRSRYFFENTAKAFKVPLEIETLSVYQEPFEPGEWRTDLHGVRVTLTEYLKWVYYRAFWRP